MYDDFGDFGFDWNGNGQRDSFDNYMDMEASRGSKRPTGSQKKSSGGIVIYDSTKDSNGVALMKALAVCGLCIIGIVIPVSGSMGELETVLWLGGCIGLSLKVLKNTSIREQTKPSNLSNTKGKEKHGKVKRRI